MHSHSEVWRSTPILAVGLTISSRRTTVICRTVEPTTGSLLARFRMHAFRAWVSAGLHSDHRWPFVFAGFRHHRGIRGSTVRGDLRRIQSAHIRRTPDVLLS